MKKIVVICIIIISSFCIGCSAKEKASEEGEIIKENDKNRMQNKSGEEDAGSKDDFDLEEFLLQENTSVSHDYYADVKGLIAVSEYVISGRIIDKQEIEIDNGAKKNYLYSIEVSKVYKGEQGQTELEFTVSSLQIGMTIKENGEQAELIVGEEFLLLLNEEEDRFTVSSTAQSIYLISEDKSTTAHGTAITFDDIIKYLDKKEDLDKE